MILLDRLLGVAGPVAADLVVRQRHAVAGVAERRRARSLPSASLHGQHRQVVIDRPALGAAVDREIDRCRCRTRASPGLQVLQRGERDLLELVGQLAACSGRCRVWCSGGIGGRRASARRRVSIGAVCVCVQVIARRPGRASPSSPAARRPRASSHRGTPRLSTAHDAPPARAASSAERERLGPDPLRDAFGLRAAEAEAAQPDRVVRRDVDLGDADAVVGGRQRASAKIPTSAVMSWGRLCMGDDCNRAGVRTDVRSLTVTRRKEGSHRDTEGTEACPTRRAARAIRITRSRMNSIQNRSSAALYPDFELASVPSVSLWLPPVADDPHYPRIVVVPNSPRVIGVVRCSGADDATDAGAAVGSAAGSVRSTFWRTAASSRTSIRPSAVASWKGE